MKRENCGKTASKAEESRWIGFDEESKGNRIHWLGKRPATVKRNAKFNKDVFVTLPHFMDDDSPAPDPSKGPPVAPAAPIRAAYTLKGQEF